MCAGARPGVMASMGQSFLPSSRSAASFHACRTRHRLSSIRLSGIDEVALRQCISDGTAGAPRALFYEGDRCEGVSPPVPVDQETPAPGTGVVRKKMVLVSAILSRRRGGA